jgi:hypothetical protein
LKLHAHVHLVQADGDLRPASHQAVPGQTANRNEDDTIDAIVIPGIGVEPRQLAYPSGPKDDGSCGGQASDALLAIAGFIGLCAFVYIRLAPSQQPVNQSGQLPRTPCLLCPPTDPRRAVFAISWSGKGRMSLDGARAQGFFWV